MTPNSTVKISYFCTPLPVQFSNEAATIPNKKLTYNFFSFQVLTFAMGLLRKCRVNAALTIQLFSQLFHYINMWTFNEIVNPEAKNYCTHR